MQREERTQQSNASLTHTHTHILKQSSKQKQSKQGLTTSNIADQSPVCGICPGSNRVRRSVSVSEVINNFARSASPRRPPIYYSAGEVTDPIWRMLRRR